MIKALTYRTVLNAWECIDRDPDVFPEEVMTAIVVNRGALEEKRDSYQNRQTALVHRHGEPLGEDNGKVQVSTKDPAYLLGRQDVLDETIDVPIRTITLDAARSLAASIQETEGDDAAGASVSDWHWMIE